MNRTYPLVAAAVAVALGSGIAAAASPPSLAAAASTAYSLIIAGSSAAQSSIQNAFEVDACGGAANALSVQSSGNKNFFAFSCVTANVIGSVPAGTLVTVYYRSEGGSVTGALPLISGASIQRLLLTDPSCTVSSSGTIGTCAVTGVTATNGPNDSWTGAVTKAQVQLGVTDVEPAQLTNLDYPKNYSTSVFGTATPAQLAALSVVPAVQQVFGLAVNTTGMTLNTSANGPHINLSAESVANILERNYTNWNSVPDALTGQPVTTNSVAITRIDREPGSGTRTQANIYFLHYQCGSTTGINNTTNEQLNYSTGDELTQANTVGGSIAYASIDNILPPKASSYSNLVPVYLNGIEPSTLAAATGQYDDWFEATLVTPDYSIPADAAAISSWLQTDLPNLSAAPLQADINVIPNVGTNSATVPLTSNSNGTITVYINPFTRGGNSCNVPSETN